MNFLGHLFLSDNDPPLMLANLYGDFVKGKDYTYLPEIVQKGVTLHRKIDDFIDQHELVKELRLDLYTELPKIAGIAIDLYFDHLLAKEWKNFHPTPLDEYVDAFFEYALKSESQHIKSKNFTYPSNFSYLIFMIHKHEWIKKYKDPEGLGRAAEGLSKRISFENNLSDALKVYNNNAAKIKVVFDLFMRDALKEFNI